MKILIIIDQPPYGSSKSQESLDMALALAAFDGLVSVLFTGFGVTNFLSEQLPKNQGLKDFTRLIKGLDLYDINDIYLDKIACENLNLSSSNLLTEATLLDKDAIRDLIQTHHRVIKI